MAVTVLSGRFSMYYRLSLSYILLSLVAASLFAQTSVSPSSSTAPDAADLTKLLNDFLDGASRNDPRVHERFWADDLIYTTSAGRRKGKPDILRELRDETSSPKPSDGNTSYRAEDIRIQQYGDTAIVAFRLVATTRKAEQTDTANYLNTGTFLKRDGRWQAVAWQATKMP